MELNPFFTLTALGVVLPLLAFAAEPPAIPLSDAAAKLPSGTAVAVMELENGGVVEIQLLADEAPLTAANFRTLVEEGFYDGIPFHRVVPGFVVQAGDATLVGRENPDRKLAVEPDKRECKRGAVSMARGAYQGPAGNWIYADTSPTQFFILKKDSPHLDADFCVFGYVVSGMNVVDKIQQGDVISKISIREIP